MMEQEATMDQDAIRTVLRRRADALARRENTVERRAEFLAVTVAVRGGVRFAVPTSSVLEVRSVRATVLPQANAVVQGLFVWQGSAVGLTDLASTLGAKVQDEVTDRLMVLIVHCGGHTTGIRIDDILGTRMVYRDEIDTGSVAGVQPWIIAMTKDVLLVIDPDRLSQDASVKLGGG